MVKLHYDKAHKRIYVLDEIYERGLTNTALAPILKEFVGNHYVLATAQNQRALRNLQNLGIRALPAKKGRRFRDARVTVATRTRNNC